MNEDIKVIFSNNFIFLMDRNGDNVADFSEKTGIAYSTVNDWKNGKKMPRGGSLQKIANYYGVNISDLTSNTSLRNSVKNKMSIDKIVRIPVIGEIACGDPILAEENISGYREEPSDYLPHGNLFYLQTKGNSMTPIIPENSYVLIREQSEVEDGEIAAVLVNGDTEATLKRIKRQGDMMMLVAENSDYAPYIVTEDNPARVIGKAVKVSFDL